MQFSKLIGGDLVAHRHIRRTYARVPAPHAAGSQHSTVPAVAPGNPPGPKSDFVASDDAIAVVCQHHVANRWLESELTPCTCAGRYAAAAESTCCAFAAADGKSLQAQFAHEAGRLRKLIDRAEFSRDVRVFIERRVSVSPSRRGGSRDDDPYELRSEAGPISR